MLDLVKILGQTTRDTDGLVILVLLNICVKIDWFCILDKDFTKLSLPLVVDPSHELGSVEMSEPSTDHLVGQVVRIEHPIIVDAHRDHFNVKFKLPHVLKRLEEDLDRLVRVLRRWNLAASNSLIILVDGRDHIVLENFLEQSLVNIVSDVLIEWVVN